MEIKRINLLKYRGNNSTLFTGRPQGETARDELNLDKKDNDDNKYAFIIPKGTTSFNPSFYLGLLYNSIKKMGLIKVKSKYIFKFEDENNEKIVNVLNENLEDGRRYAINTLGKKSSFKNFFIK